MLPLPVKSQISSEPSWEELLVLSADRLAPLVILTLRLAPAKARVSMPPPPLLPLPVVRWFTRYKGIGEDDVIGDVEAKSAEVEAIVATAAIYDPASSRSPDKSKSFTAAMGTLATTVTLAVVKLRKRRIDFLRAGSPKSSTPQSIFWIRLHSDVNPVETLLRPHAALVRERECSFYSERPMCNTLLVNQLWHHQ